MDLSDLKSRLNNENKPPTVRIASTLDAIALAEDRGGEILIVSPNATRSS